MSENQIKLDIVEADGKMQVLPPASIYGVQKKWDGTIGTFSDEESSNQEWADWGANDCLPTTIRKKIESVPMASAAICKLIAMMFGNGLCYHLNSDLEGGNTTIKRAYLPEVEKFLQQNRIRQEFLIGQIADYRYYMNTFSELIFSKGGEIIGIHHLPAEFCRLAKQNEKNLRIEKIFFGPEWGQNQEPERDHIVQIPLFSYYDFYFDQEKYRKKLKGKMAWHSRYPTPGITYYAKPFWLALFKEEGWMDVAANVPKILSAMQRNQVSLKYQILIPESYFMIRHTEWSNYSKEQRDKEINSFVKKLNDMLSSPDNQFKSITTIFKDDPSFANALGKVEIKAIDDKIKANNWVPSSNTADAQIVQGLGLHPSQMGLAPEGGKMGAGSGSDQRESYNTQISLNTIDQQIILEPLNFISEYNGWGVTFFIDHTAHTTTNNQEDGLQPSDTTIISE